MTKVIRISQPDQIYGQLNGFNDKINVAMMLKSNKKYRRKLNPATDRIYIHANNETISILISFILAVHSYAQDM